MKKSLLPPVGAAMIALLSLSSCVSPYGGPNQSVGSVLGAATGAIAGAAIGNQSCRPLEGAAIGGVIGAVAGAALGSAQDDYYGTHYDHGEPVYARRNYYAYDYHYYPPPVYRPYYYAHPYYHRGGHCW